ncbi:hypothetical protein ABZ484_20380 [Streptomyces sp. NPDC006393]|uniref:hypothetical protein n=1 Tax=Streptomyces sp. NPDC006393 TaxID=3156763 RepID=UPI0033EFEA2F
MEFRMPVSDVPIPAGGEPTPRLADCTSWTSMWTGTIDRPNEGQVPFFEPGVAELLTKSLDSGRLRCTSSSAEACDFGDVHFICVSTPQRPDSSAADLQYVDSAAAEPGGASALACPCGRQVHGARWYRARVTEPVRRVAPAGDAVEVAWNLSSCARGAPWRHAAT